MSEFDIGLKITLIKIHWAKIITVRLRYFFRFYQNVATDTLMSLRYENDEACAV